jgi:membrane protein YdbS with pleckstrin-like domain
MRPENEWFKPEKLTPYFFLYEALAVVGLAAVATAVVVFAPPSDLPTWALALVGALVVGAFAYLTWWIPAFYRTAAYRLTDDAIEYRRGVFYRQRTTVPYNRITNVDAYQGPVQRIVGAGSVGVHTAGYGGQMGAELTVGGVADFDDVKAQVLGKVRRRPPEATEAEADGDADHPPVSGGTDAAAMLAELRRIRELLERDRSA